MTKHRHHRKHQKQRHLLQLFLQPTPPQQQQGLVTSLLFHALAIIIIAFHNLVSTVSSLTITSIISTTTTTTTNNFHSQCMMRLASSMAARDGKLRSFRFRRGIKFDQPYYSPFPTSISYFKSHASSARITAIFGESTNDNNNNDDDDDDVQSSMNETTYKSLASIHSQSPPDPSTFPSWSYEPRPFFHFELLHQSTRSLARVGRIHTPHGIIDTPSYVAVATNGALKGVDFRSADSANQQLIFCNTYHMLLQPGVDIVEKAGGLHTFVNRKDRPFITDSGGFQVFSLAYGSVHEELSSGGELKRASRGRKERRDNNTGSAMIPQNNSVVKKGIETVSTPPPPTVKVTEDGVVFRSYRDGTKFLLTPESTVRAQKSLGADIIIPLDELPPYHIDRRVLEQSVERTHRWEARSLIEHLTNVKEQAMYCVIHGGLDRTLRQRSLEYLTSLPFDGYAIGGSLGKNGSELLELLEWMMPLLNENVVGGINRKSKPRHLLGIADEPSILGAIRCGIDTMDSCYPTRLGRHGTLLSRSGKVHIKSGVYSRQYGVPIDPECSCTTCQQYDRSYLWHLFKAKEPIFMTLATIHNIHYMNDLMAQQRQLILEDKI